MEELALSQWGRFADEFDEVELSMLTHAYIRRKRFEGQASLAALGQAIQDSKQERVAPEAMALMMGGL